MNLFLPFPDDLSATARFLDDSRLNKQVVEAYQIGQIAVKRMLDPDAKIGWRNHPSALLVYNEGHPKLPWLQTYIEALDAEWRSRGFRRSEEFLVKLEALFAEAKKLGNRLSYDPVCSFLGDGKLVHGDAKEIGRLYRDYLTRKFEKQPRPPKWTNQQLPW
jgi:hypothetical protein